jgi:hypothetical protein
MINKTPIKVTFPGPSEQTLWPEIFDIRNAVSVGQQKIDGSLGEEPEESSEGISVYEIYFVQFIHQTAKK